ncbi:hypothetical protein EVAR_46575_1 [Eumeta japonica]|uniref:Uncharacterized protein n=1 Tax=Eumeta variegata TaxID=151549 RepID=A0A4C1WPK5_EUMVA|nr:hypothetical protein EVAR_46575_1 [Eumeta japonica]
MDYVSIFLIDNNPPTTRPTITRNELSTKVICKKKKTTYASFKAKYNQLERRNLEWSVKRQRLNQTRRIFSEATPQTKAAYRSPAPPRRSLRAISPGVCRRPRTYLPAALPSDRRL